MDLSAIKAKLASIESRGEKREKVDYEKIFWKPGNGKHQIRIVPSKFNRAMPFRELLFHYGIGKYPMLALSNFGEQDPIEEFTNELRKTSDKDNWSMAGKLSPKMRIFAPVIVRGEEDKGVRLWGFGKEVYKTLLQLAEDEDVGDYTDVTSGFDLSVNVTPGNPYPSTTVSIKPKVTALSDNSAKVDNWLNEQPDPLASFNKYDYEFIKKQLQSWLNPDAEQAEEAPAAAPAAATPAPVAEVTQAPAPAMPVGSFKASEIPSPPIAQPYTLETKEKPTVVDKFDELFSNDLPF
jgi:hypothetical protein